MARNLYILAATLAFLALICFGLSFEHYGPGPSSPGDTAMWRMMAIGGLFVALVVALAANLSTLFSQAERRADEQRLQRRKERSAHRGTE